MDLSCLLPLISELAALKGILDDLRRTRARPRITVLNSAQPFLLAALYQQLRKPVLAVTPGYESARRLYDQLHVWCPLKMPLKLFPELDRNAEDGLLGEAALERLRTLALLAMPPDDGVSTPVVITWTEAATGPVMSRETFLSACIRLKTGDSADPMALIELLYRNGYEVGPTVEVPGTASRRGGIMDIFSPQAEHPFRIEFMGNRIETIRTFDPRTQRSITRLDAVRIVPAREPPESTTGTILSYMPADGLLVLEDPEAINQVLERPARELLEAAATRQNRVLELLPWGGEAPSLPFVPVPSYGGKLDEFVKGLKSLPRDGARTIIVSHQARRLSEYLQENDLVATPLTELCQVPQPGSLTLLQGSVAEGWVIDGSIRLFSDREIFGFVKQRRQVQKRPVHWQTLLAQFRPGDYIVHVEHGIGRFIGLVKQSQNGTEREYLVIEYSQGDKLYVPVDRIDRINRYVGTGDEPPALNRLGTQEWARTRTRVKKAVEDIARDLLQLYAAREATPGHAFSPDTLWQQEIEAAFPYVETPDQMEAVGAVKGDMEKPRAMDRLICGDVGYGKTEVALRAAFKAVMDGKQAAMLVPTTILAQQHYMTFKERLQAYPVKVAMLSRFCSPKEERSIVEGLGAGGVDICIGTHRLLQKDVAFKELGLVIIDEEQRFGVVHKERLKQMKREVDVLTLSATPIPRTLYMSMVGVRDMSTIETPPDERLPIKTHVGQYDDSLVRQAIVRELERGGQVFVVHNRVESIGGVAVRLQALVPEARIAVAHGRMPEEQLEEIMMKFTRGEADVLVSTTIIESGLDMPNVNTLIVTDSDRLGLTQLHQLRGRVGRGVDRAAAYFLYPKEKRLTPQATKRLRTIFEFTELGAGFGIALRDLEIRGAGNLLGIEQSGHIAAVGFDLYCRLLGEAIAELKEKGVPAEVSLKPVELPLADLPLSAHIPKDYVEDENVRVSLYYRLTRMERPEQVEDLRRELADRFDSLPPPVANLLFVVEARLLARDAGLESISWDHEYVVLQLTEERKTRPVRITPERYRDRVRVGTGQVRLDTHNMREPWQDMLKTLLKEMAS
ncbi:MAG: transcription-repair coupling factor [Chloroflexota bacterium]